MSPEKKRLENNREIVDQHIAKKEISFAEPVDMEGALEFLDYLIKEGISDDFAVAQFNKRRQFIQNNEVFPMIYMMNILSGDWSVRRTQTILQNEAALNMMGFTDKQIENKLTQRGKRTNTGKDLTKSPE